MPHPNLHHVDGQDLELRGQTSLSFNGLVLSLDGHSQAGTRVRSIRPESDLRFGSLTIINLNVTVPLASFTEAHWAKKAQWTIGVRSLLNRRQVVRDRNEATPSGFRAEYLDPLGRIITVAPRAPF